MICDFGALNRYQFNGGLPPLNHFVFVKRKHNLLSPPRGQRFSIGLCIALPIGLFDEKFKELTHFVSLFSELNMVILGTFD